MTTNSTAPAPVYSDWDEMERLAATVANAKFSPVTQDEFIDRLGRIVNKLERDQCAELRRRADARKAVGT